MARLGIKAIGCLLGAGALLAQPGQAPQARRTWADYGGGPDNARYVSFDAITKANIDTLRVAWTYPTADNVSYVFGPVVAHDVAFVLARNTSLVALDATTGREIWVHEGLQGIAPRGINYWESPDGSDRRLLFQRNNYLEAIDARTGRSILTFGTNGAVNLREGLRRDPATVSRVQSSNPGKIFENLILLGSATGERYMATPGDIRAFDVVTGALVWQFHTIPHPGEFGYDTWPKDAWKYVGGVNTWGEITVDAVRGIAYFPTGSPTYDYYGADRHGANLFGTSLVALDARTGKRLWHFQMVHHDLFDYDNTAAPQLTTVRHDGQLVDVVAQAGKTGFLYVFNRVTGEPLWPIEERPVPQSTVPGEQSWPTQPFPTGPPPFANQALTESDVNPYILSPNERAAWVERIRAARNEGLFTPPTLGVETIAIPGAQGGANWGTTAANPINGSFYVLSINVPSIYRLSADAPGRSGVARGGRAGGSALPVDAAAAARGRSIYEQRCQACHGTDRRGVAPVPSLVDISMRIGPEVLREVIAGGRLSMPANNLSDAEMTSLLAYLANPASADGRGRGGRGAGPVPALGGPVVASGGAPGNLPGPFGGGGMIGPAYPDDVDAPSVRYYTDYGMQNVLVKPPYSTLTAYDLNTGTIRWQVPAGGDDPRALAEGAHDTGFPRARTGIITTATGLLFQAGLDGKLRAYDEATGRVLWTGDLPAGSVGIPAMYEAGGRQFIVVNATTASAGRGQGAPASGRAYVAFSLPD